MDLEKNITDILLLEQIYALPDRRPLSMADREAANQQHDHAMAENPWFKLWRQYGI
ncbi:MAG: hypothetical protein P4M01_02595 [Acidobacteriota bacterium]|nr:hypothetical protein [Acidobacteriota bacterium]